ncbi:hypothetical protein G7046_g6338 [Stylonectria norvegica]|nr:hypothetical protein G7046_g6338 [Stylonectria norvegica]
MYNILPGRQLNELSIVVDGAPGSGSPDELDSLLARGANPNSQPGKVGEFLSQVEPDWASPDPPPQFESRGEQWQPPLYCATQHVIPSQGQADEGVKMATSLLRYGADPFLEFPQPLYYTSHYRRFQSPFPGEDPPRRPLPQEPRDMDDFKEWWENGDHYSSDEDVEDEDTSSKWGARHVLHAIIEDGGSLRPFLDFPGFLQLLDVEHRDPQGRTLLLSACRSALGADARADGVLGALALAWNDGDSGDNNNPFSKWDRDSVQSDYAEPTETFVDILLRLGADPLAIDNQGKNVLHHLLVEVSSNQNVEFYYLPVVRRTLRIFASKYPSLVNQHDHHGLYPLHAALRRMRLHQKLNLYVNMAEPEGCVVEMLNAGADARVKDRKGNTALHYAADNDLTCLWFGTERREIFYDLLDKHGCIEDINLPNHRGKSVVELILDDNGRMEDDKDIWYGRFRHTNADEKWYGLLGRKAKEEGRDLREWKDVDEEVFDKLDKAGVDWKVKPSDGGTLLHLVAQSGLLENRLIWRTRFLLQKGLDLMAIDKEGKTI